MEQLQNLLRLTEIQDNINVLRTEVPSIYNQYLRKEAKCDVEKLRSANIDTRQKPLTIPNLDQVKINHNKLRPAISFSELQQQSQDVMKCIQYMKKSN